MIIRLHKFIAFSLIEVMIVATITGILGMTSIKSYKNYILRVEVSKVINFMAPIKNAVSEYYELNNKWPSNIQELGYNPQGDWWKSYNPDIDSWTIEEFSYEVTSSTSTTQNCKPVCIQIHINTNKLAGDLRTQFAPVLDKDGKIIRWTCKGSFTTRSDKKTIYLPPICR